MKKVYQKIIDKDKGDCMRACICSLLEIDDRDIPNFIEEGDYGESYSKILKQHECKEVGMLWNPNLIYFTHPTEYCFDKAMLYEKALFENISNFRGIKGLFIASVYSPKYFNYQEGLHQTHAVIIDKDFNIVHDPNPEYASILEYPLSRLIGYNGIRNIYLIERKFNFNR